MHLQLNTKSVLSGTKLAENRFKVLDMDNNVDFILNDFSH